MSVGEAAAWIEQAKHDEDTARLIRDHAGHPDIGVYHLHQAVEKLLKALLVQRGDQFERTHVLDLLYSKAVPYCPELSQVVREVVALDRYLPRLRYPTGDDVTKHNFRECFGYYERIRTVVVTCLEARGVTDV